MSGLQELDGALPSEPMVGAVPVWPRRAGVRDFAMASDTVLVVAIGRWEQAALAEAYRRHAGAAYALARRVGGDAGLAEEVVQELFVRLWTNPERFDPERGSLRSYLLAQTHGRCIDRLRSDISRRQREEREMMRAAEAGCDVEQEAWGLVLADRVKEVLSALSEEERQAIELAYFGGYTYREVAQLLDAPEGTIKSRIRAGLKRMRPGLIDMATGEP